MMNTGYRQPNPGIPVYEVKSVAGGRTRVLHHNLLLPLQGDSGNKMGRKGKNPKALRRRSRKKIAGYLVCLRHPGEN